MLADHADGRLCTNGPALLETGNHGDLATFLPTHRTTAAGPVNSLPSGTTHTDTDTEDGGGHGHSRHGPRLHGIQSLQAAQVRNGQC